MKTNRFDSILSSAILSSAIAMGLFASTGSLAWSAVGVIAGKIYGRRRFNLNPDVGEYGEPQSDAMVK